jgi:hypothetical protein
MSLPDQVPPVPAPCWDSSGEAGAPIPRATPTSVAELAGDLFVSATPVTPGRRTGAGRRSRCIDGHAAGTGRLQIDIVVRHCAAVCTEAQRAELDTLSDHPATYRVRDAATRYAGRPGRGAEDRQRHLGADPVAVWCVYPDQA